MIPRFNLVSIQWETWILGDRAFVWRSTAWLRRQSGHREIAADYVLSGMKFVFLATREGLGKESTFLFQRGDIYLALCKVLSNSNTHAHVC